MRPTDVIRAALGEVESYQRVRVRDTDPATVIGSAAADLAHLLAELIENALVFSPPDRQVLVRGRPHPAGGYPLAVIDARLGKAGAAPAALDPAEHAVSVRCMERVVRAAVGRALVDGHDVRKRPVEERVVLAHDSEQHPGEPVDLVPVLLGSSVRFFGQLDAQKGWVQQLHLGAMRNNNGWALQHLGPDTGFDSVGDYHQGPGLSRFLGTLAARATRPVDVVTGDRDLFQTVDDARAVRVLYIARGVGRHEVIDESAITGRYHIPGRAYADYALLRGDPSDGLPGAVGIGEKTAATLMTTYGTVDAVLAAAADRSSDMTASVRRKVLASYDYLVAARSVVRVATDLDTGVVNDALPDTPADPAGLLALADRLALDASCNRLLAALDRVAAGAGEGGGS